MAGWNRLQMGPPVPQKDTHFSTLEVNHNPWLENDGRAAPIVGRNAQDEKILHCNDIGKQVVVDQDKEVFDASDTSPELLPPLEQGKIFGLRYKTFFIILAVVLILTTAASVSGGVVGRIRAYRPSSAILAAPTVTRVPYANTGLAAIHWSDLNGTLHKRLYYQNEFGRICESAWDSDAIITAGWKTTTISNIVKSVTPLAAVTGYPKGNTPNRMVCSSYALLCAVY